MIRRVAQQHDTGCFIATVAMLLGITYVEAFYRMYPGKYMPPPGHYMPHSTMIDEALAMLPRLGLEIKWSGLHTTRALKKRTSLIVLRWHNMLHLSHALVFDGERGCFVDPHFRIPLNHRALNKNLFGIYYVKRITPHELPIPNTDTHGHQGASGLPEQGSLPSSQGAAGDACW